MKQTVFLPAVEKLVSRSLTIPQFGQVEKTESLNVATATAILLSEFRRQEELLKGEVEEYSPGLHAFNISHI
jgi:tRNA(Leu) C34 or U34 (ribose-2'-O)-methylase TrmL